MWACSEFTKLFQWNLQKLLFTKNLHPRSRNWWTAECFLWIEETDLGIYSAAVSTFEERYKSSGAPCCTDFWLSKKICSEVAKYATFVCVDDEHRINIGEPSCPVATAERGSQLLAHSSTSYVCSSDSSSSIYTSKSSSLKSQSKLSINWSTTSGSDESNLVAELQLLK